MKKYKVALLLLTLIVSGGCEYDNHNDQSSLLGAHHTELIDRLGEPREIIDDGTGGKIYSWSDIPIDRRQIDDPARREYRIDDVYRVNAQGTVYRKGL